MESNGDIYASQFQFCVTCGCYLRLKNKRKGLVEWNDEEFPGRWDHCIVSGLSHYQLLLLEQKRAELAKKYIELERERLSNRVHHCNCWSHQGALPFPTVFELVYGPCLLEVRDHEEEWTAKVLQSVATILKDNDIWGASVWKSEKSGLFHGQDAPSTCWRLLETFAPFLFSWISHYQCFCAFKVSHGEPIQWSSPFEWLFSGWVFACSLSSQGSSAAGPKTEFVNLFNNSCRVIWVCLLVRGWELENLLSTDDRKPS